MQNIIKTAKKRMAQPPIMPLIIMAFVAPSGMMLPPSFEVNWVASKDESTCSSAMSSRATFSKSSKGGTVMMYSRRVVVGSSGGRMNGVVVSNTASSEDVV